MNAEAQPQTCVVFDLDDTLFLERDYVRSGFEAVGRHVRKVYGTDGFAACAWGHFLDGGRGNSFNVACQATGIEPTPDRISEMVRVYRNHDPDIELLPDARAAIGLVRQVARIAVITDGPFESQAAKARVLGVHSYADPVIYTAELGDGYGKPHTASFELVSAQFALPPELLIYVADNPAKDFVAPRALGWRTVRVRRPESLHTQVPSGPDVHTEIHDLTTLPTVLGLP
jgi:putative hydrolase of the HAD superfamily